MSGDGFLSRWAKRKALVRQGVEVEADAPHPPSTSSGQAKPLPRGAREQAPRGSGGEPPTGSLDALSPQALGHPSTHADSEALAPSPLWGEGRGEGHGPLPPPAAPPKTLADVAALTPDADFQPFLSPQVEEHVKRAALKKLFTDPHFNIMDGLDTYIDDYSKPDPIPESMLRRMAQSKALGLFDEPEEDAHGEPQDAIPPTAKAAPDTASTDPPPPRESNPQSAPPTPHPEASPDGAGFAELTQSATAPQAVPRHEDPDLRLQQDNAAGRGGTREGAAG